jgi:Domain of unknown function (DUF4123)
VQPDAFSPRAWLEHHPLKPSEQLFAVFGNASAAEPLKAWQRSITAQAPSPIWADTAYAEWGAVMPYVGIVAAGSGFLDWVASTDALDWGWLLVSSASHEVLVEQFRSLTLVRLPTGEAVFFRFWDGRHLLPILRSPEVDVGELLPLIGRCLINGESLEVAGRATAATQAFPWWDVPKSLLERLGTNDAATRINNLLTWLSEDRPDVFEAFSETVLRRKVARFLDGSEPSGRPKQALAEYLVEEQR